MNPRNYSIVLISILLFCVINETRLLNNSRTNIAETKTLHTQNFNNNENNQASITIISPKNSSYNQNNILFNFTIETDVPYFSDFHGNLFDLWFRYECLLDSKFTKFGYDALNQSNYGLLADNNVEVNLTRYEKGYLGTANLTNLSEGNHNVTVLIRAEDCWLSTFYIQWNVSSTTLFHVDMTSPNVDIMTPEPKTYETSNVPLVFTVNENFTKISYYLDGKETEVNTQNITLTNLSNGNHDVTIHATDEAGNLGISKTVTFEINKKEPFLLIVVLSIITFLIIISLIYLVKRNRSKS